MVNKYIKPVVDFLYPQQCLLCGLCSHRDIAICSGCERDLSQNRHCCQLCALPLITTELDLLCGRCQQDAPNYDLCISPWLYDDSISGLIRPMKFQANLAAANALGKLLARELTQHYSDSDWPDLLIPMPLHWSRLWRRGFNQATEISLAVLSGLLELNEPKQHLPRLASGHCKRVRRTTSQASLGAKSRSLNMSHAFQAKSACSGQYIALLDDVITTGATVAAAASSLQLAGAAEIHIWSLARTPLPTSRNQTRDGGADTG
jgi:ComF family protein